MEHTDLELYIQLRDGQPHEHPIFADNFKQAFPEVDVNNLPADRFAKFIRVEQPAVGTYEVYEGVTYQWVDGVVKDVHAVRAMTAEERVAKTTALTDEANKVKADRIAFIEDILAKETNAAAFKLWGDCLAAHQLWVLQSVDPITPPFPLFPAKDKDGNWVAL